MPAIPLPPTSELPSPDSAISNPEIILGKSRDLAVPIGGGALNNVLEVNLLPIADQQKLSDSFGFGLGAPAESSAEVPVPVLDSPYILPAEVNVYSDKTSIDPIQLNSRNVLVGHGYIREGAWVFADGRSIAETVDSYNKTAKEQGLPPIDVLAICNDDGQTEEVKLANFNDVAHVVGGNLGVSGVFDKTTGKYSIDLRPTSEQGHVFIPAEKTKDVPLSQLTSPLPESSYGTDLTTATDNFNKGKYENSKNAPETVPEELRINNTSSFTEIRDRLAHEGLLSQEELEAVMNLAVGNTVSAVSRLIPNAAEFRGVFELFSDKAKHHTKINRENGTGQDPYIKGDIITVDVTQEDKTTEKLSNSPDINWKNPGDARLIKYISGFVHEHGHAVARKIAESSNPPGKYSNSFFASYLSAYPSEGYTGILGSDPNIYDERYANGLAVLTITDTMSKLGYSEAEQQAAIKLCMPLDQEYSEGKHHHVEAVEHARQRNITIGQAALELSGLESSDHLAYEGGLGYKKPLTPEQLGEVFYFAKQITEDGVSAFRFDTARYREAFDAQYGGETHPDVKERLATVRASKVA